MPYIIVCSGCKAQSEPTHNQYILPDGWVAPSIAFNSNTRYVHFCKECADRLQLHGPSYSTDPMDNFIEWLVSQVAERLPER